MLLFEVIKTLAPKASPLGLAAWERADEILPAHNICLPLRLPHFLCHALHETGGLSNKTLTEGLNYTTPQRIMSTFKGRFANLADAARFVRRPEALANRVYANINGNGDEASGDGWRYPGRGILQLTGRGNYAAVGDVLGVDLVLFPELAASEEWALPCAAAWWQLNGCNELAETDDVRRLTRRINGGYNGLEDRIAWLAKVRAALGV